VRFVLLFPLFFVLGQAAYYALRPHEKFLMIDRFSAGVSSKIINFITPKEKTTVTDNEICSGDFMIAVQKGCDGMDVIILMTAALCALTLGWKRKTAGVLTGVVLIYLANLIRIVGLYFVSKYRLGVFDVMHIYVGQTFIVLIGVVFFLVWINNCEPVHGKTR
jgi:exosortase family protein XrtM